MHYLINHADKGDSCCWPGRRRMQRDLGGQTDSFKTWIEQLAKSYWLRAENYSPDKHLFVRVRDRFKRDGMIYWLLNGDRQSPQPFWKPETPAVLETGITGAEKVETPAVVETGNEIYSKNNSLGNLETLNLPDVPIVNPPAFESSKLKASANQGSQSRASECDFMERLESLFKPSEYSADGAKWRMRWRKSSQHRSLCRTILEDSESVKRERREIVGTYAGRFEDYWKRWGGKELDEKFAAQ